MLSDHHHSCRDELGTVVDVNDVGNTIAGKGVTIVEDFAVVVAAAAVDVIDQSMPKVSPLLELPLSRPLTHHFVTSSLGLFVCLLPDDIATTGCNI